MTNAPRRWSVRPNGGVLEPGQTIAVSLTLTRPSAKDSLAGDHHLILSVPISREEATRLYELRTSNGKASIPALTIDNPQVRAVRRSPLPDTPAAPAIAVSLTPACPLPACQATQARVSPLLSAEDASSAVASPMNGHFASPNGTHNSDDAAGSDATASAGDDSDMSVAERVKDLQRRFSSSGAALVSKPAAPSAGANGSPQADSAASPRARADAGSPGAGGPRQPMQRQQQQQQNGGDGSEGDDDEAEATRHPLLRLLSRMFGSYFDEFEPWLKWKVYDVLFALLLVFLGRRLRHPVAQRALEFVGEA